MNIFLTLPQCLAMVELTLVGWKDPVVLDLPTTARELKAAVHHRVGGFVIHRLL